MGEVVPPRDHRRVEGLSWTEEKEASTVPEQPLILTVGSLIMELVPLGPPSSNLEEASM